MKIKLVVDGLVCEAEFDIPVADLSDKSTKTAAKAAAFARICEELRQIAFRLIDRKYSNNPPQQ